MDEFSFPLVAKDIRSSRGEGVSLLTRRSELVAHAAERETLYIQERLPIDRDLRIVWVGDEIVGAYWRIAREGEFHNNVSRGGDVSYGPVPAVALDLVTEVARKLGIDHAGFDVAMVDGHPYIFEFNVRFGNKALPVTQAELATRIHTYLSRRSETKPPRAAVL